MRLDTTDEYKRGAEIMDGGGMKGRCHMAGLLLLRAWNSCMHGVAVIFAFHRETRRRYGRMERRDEDRL
jgi:hypothetical protein